MKPMLLLMVIIFITSCSQKPKEIVNFPFKDTKLSIEQRVNDLVGRMTLEEKIGQMVNDAPAIGRLGIAQYNWWNECLHGVARAGLATVYPQAIGLGATWDEDLIFRMATTISDEARAKYHKILKLNNQSLIFQGLTFWSPNINLFRDPRWGRGQETYGEDPFLTGKLAVQFIKGLQDDPKYFKPYLQLNIMHAAVEPDGTLSTRLSTKGIYAKHTCRSLKWV
jgi:beta-glucosidase